MTLDEFGFTSDFEPLKCRVCGQRINKYGYSRLLNTTVRYGWCRWYTHGITVMKAMK